MKSSQNSHSNPQNLEEWGRRFEEYRAPLLRLASRNMCGVLTQRVSPEDAVQMALADACRKIPYFERNPEIPLYFKLRTLLLQTITDLERCHLKSQKRDAFKEERISDSPGTQTEAWLGWNMLADSISSPTQHIRHEERDALLRQALEELPENDRCILQLRHFDGMSNQECAEILHIEPKAASIRYVRALQRLRDRLIALSEFHR